MVERYSAYVYALVRSARVPEADQADAFQHVFVELFRALPKLRTDDSLRPWLRQTALRHAIRVRSKAERAPISLEDDEPVDAGFEAQIEREDRAQLIREAVSGLQDRCRELVQRLFFADPPEPYTQVAEALGIKVQSLGMTRQRCLEALERALRARGIP